jgi:hypothetical protein
LPADAGRWQARLADTAVIRFPRSLLAAVLIAALAACGGEPSRQEPPAAVSDEGKRDGRPVPGAAAHLRELDRIARRNGGNRAAGTPGDRATAAYVEGRLRAAGYEVTRQRVRFPYFEALAPPRVSRAGAPLPGGRRAVRLLHFTPGGSARGSVRRIRTGCTPAQAAPLRSGDIALARRGTCTFRRKARLAAAGGAAALLVAGRRGEPLVTASLRGPGVPIPALFVTHDAARRLRTGERVSVDVRAISGVRTSDNVIAGAPRPAGRTAIMGAHLDSVPESPGLNDNGSGVAAVLDAAERLAAEGAPPTRIRFAFWTAEELGLLGSRHFVRRLGQARRRSIAAYLNLDMVGSPRPRPTVYAAEASATTRRLERLLVAGLRRAGVRGRPRAIPRRSDHAPFARAGIPVGGLFTGAGRPADACYHRPCDDLSNVDVATTQAMADAARRALVQITRAA